MKTLLKSLVMGAAFVAAVEATAAEPIEVCESYHGLAEAIMQVRQNGGSMPQMMQITADNEVGKLLVREAFDQPRYSTEEVQRRTIENFANDVYAECLRSID